MKTEILNLARPDETVRCSAHPDRYGRAEMGGVPVCEPCAIHAVRRFLRDGG